MGENELLYTESNKPSAVHEMISDYINSEDYAIDAWRSIAENPNVSEALRAKALEYCAESERRHTNNKKFVVCFAIMVSAFTFYAVAVSKRH